MENKFLTKISTKLNNKKSFQKYSLLICVDLNKLEQHLNNEGINNIEIVFGLGKTSKLNNTGNKVCKKIYF